MLSNKEILELCSEEKITISELIHIIISECLCVDASNDIEILKKVINKNRM